MQLSEIHSYPLKSAGGMAHSEVRLDDRGPLGDRRWMLVGADAVFLSQRTLPRMAMIFVQLFDDEVQVVECAHEAASWFSDFLAHPCRLVYQPARSLRPVDPDF